MSTSKLTVAVLLATFVSAATATAQRTVSSNYTSVSTYSAPLNTPVDCDFIGRYDATIHFSGAVDKGNETVYIQVRDKNGSWSTVTTARSSQNSLYPGQFRWSVKESLSLNEWEYLDFYGHVMYGETTVRAITRRYLGRYWIPNVLGEATIYSASRST